MSTTAYTAPAPREQVRVKAKRNRWWLVALAIMVALAISVAVTSRPGDYRTLSIDNVTDSGARAMAQILRDQGVSLRQFDTLSRVSVADPAHTTLVIAGADPLSDAQVESVLAYEGDVLFIGASDAILAAVDPSLQVSYDFLPETVDSGCADPDATAAERMRVEYVGMRVTGPTTADLCFGNRSEVYGMAVVTDGAFTRTIVTNPAVYLNAQLLNDGNAALALRTAGHHENVAWYLGDYYDPTLLSGHGDPADIDVTPDLLPPGFGTAVYALAIAALLGALWKGRRFGPLAVEPLPVVVRASEATRGRARLYRRARAHGRATAALRAATAKRIGARLGLPRTSSRDEMVTAIHRATGLPPADIARTLYGASPSSDAQMMEIVNQLDALEGEVHSL